MRSLTLLFLTTATATATAQQSERPRCRDCQSPAAARAAELRAVQVRDSVWARDFGAFQREIERLLTQLVTTNAQELEARRRLADVVAGEVEAANRKQVEVMVSRFRSQLEEARREGTSIRQQLAALCDRTAKPQGYMGITFSATMRADTAGSGVEVFQFAEFPTVETVEPGSPAERAGIAKGDEILRIGGASVVGRPIVFTRLLRPGARLPIRVRHEGGSRDVVLVVGERPPALDNGCPFLDARISMAFADPPASPLPRRAVVRIAPRADVPRAAPRVAVGGAVTTTVTPPDAPAPVEAGQRRGGVAVAAPASPLVPMVTLPSAAPTPPHPEKTEGTVWVISGTRSVMMIAGATLTSMDADLRESLGVRSGVLVVGVARGTPAYSSGLKSGDVIVSAGRSAVTQPASVRRAIDGADGNELRLQIVRKRKPRSLVLRW